MGARMRAGLHALPVAQELGSRMYRHTFPGYCVTTRSQSGAITNAKHESAEASKEEQRNNSLYHKHLASEARYLAFTDTLELMFVLNDLVEQASST